MDGSLHFRIDLGRAYEYKEAHRGELEARSEGILRRKAQAQLHEQQQLALELLIELGRVSTEVLSAPSKFRSRRRVV